MWGPIMFYPPEGSEPEDYAAMVELHPLLIVFVVLVIAILAGLIATGAMVAASAVLNLLAGAG